MYITTSRSPSSETIRLATLLSIVLPFSVFVRRGIKTFDKILAGARRKGMNRVLFVTDENGKPGYLRIIAASQYDWNDIGMYKIKKAKLPEIEIKELKKLKGQNGSNGLKSKQDKPNKSNIFFKCDKASCELLGIEKNVSEMFSDTDTKITFTGAKMKKLKIKTAEFEMGLGLEKIKSGKN